MSNILFFGFFLHFIWIYMIPLLWKNVWLIMDKVYSIS